MAVSQGDGFLGEADLVAALDGVEELQGFLKNQGFLCQIVAFAGFEVDIVQVHVAHHEIDEALEETAHLVLAVADVAIHPVFRGGGHDAERGVQNPLGSFLRAHCLGNAVVELGYGLFVALIEVFVHLGKPAGKLVVAKEPGSVQSQQGEQLGVGNVRQQKGLLLINFHRFALQPPFVEIQDVLGVVDGGGFARNRAGADETAPDIREKTVGIREHEDAVSQRDAQMRQKSRDEQARIAVCALSGEVQPIAQDGREFGGVKRDSAALAEEFQKTFIHVENPPFW